MRIKNIALSLVNLRPIRYGLTKFDLTSSEQNIAGILLRLTTPGNFIRSMTKKIEKLDAYFLYNLLERK